LKKRIFILILSLILSFGVYSQTYKGQIIELTKNMYEIKVPNFDYATIYVETELQKIKLKETENIIPKIPYETRIEKNGNFEIDISELKGEYLTLYFNSKNYSYMVLKNIPKSKLSDFIKVIPVIKNIWKPTCGRDCFTIDLKKTYKQKSIKVKTDQNQTEFKRKKNQIIPYEFEREIWFMDSEYYYEYEFKK
jgi:hypothetical protein